MLILTTKYPDEVRAAFEEYAEVLDMYASDQRAMIKRGLSVRDSKVRAFVYSELADEIRSISVQQEDA